MFEVIQETRGKKAQKRWNQDKGKKGNSLNFLTGSYLQLQMIRKGVLGDAEISRDIKE